MKKFKENNKGFSLVELIVVIAIMVVLIAVLGSTILGYVDKSKYSKDISALDSINTAVKTFVADPSADQAYTDGTVYTLTQLVALDTKNVIKPILAEVFKTTTNPMKFNYASKAFKDKTASDVKICIRNGAVSVYVPTVSGTGFDPYIAGTAFDSNGNSTN